MKQTITLLLYLLIFSNNGFSQNDPNSLSDFDWYVLENTLPSNAKFQATLRNPSLQDSFHTYSHDMGDSTLERRTFNSYDIDNQRVESLELDFSNDLWQNRRKTELAYDGNGNRLQSSSFSWDQTLNEWEATVRHNYVYNNNNDVTQWVFERVPNGGDGTLENVVKADYFLNSEGHRDSAFIYNWDVDLSEWYLKDRRDYFYDTNNNLIESIDQGWDASSQIFTIRTRRLNEFDSDNNLLSSISQIWDVDILDWENGLKHEYSYDNMGNRTGDLRFNYLGGEWITNRNNEYFFDLFGNILYSRESSSFGAEFTLDESLIYFYTDLETSAQHLSSNLSIDCQFENPISVNNVIECQSEYLNQSFDFRLFDMAGKLIFQKQFDENINASLPLGLNSGIYLLNISSEGNVVLNKKIVVVD